MTSIAFPKCPRCNDNWWSNVLSPMASRNCMRCSMYYSPTSEFFALYSFVEHEKNLYWHLNNNYCEYGFNIFSCGIKLPYLPYNISPEKFKTYLTFL